jgi:hypothetical protein
MGVIITTATGQRTTRPSPLRPRAVLGPGGGAGGEEPTTTTRGARRGGVAWDTPGRVQRARGKWRARRDRR